MRAVPFYRQPRFLWMLGTLFLIVLLLGLYVDDLLALYAPFDQFLKAPAEGLRFGPDFWSAILSFLFAMAMPVVARELFYRLVSQFVLPASTPDERRYAVEHFMRYTSGLPGPLVFVKDGQLIASASEKGKTQASAGVAWVDSASCLVLRTDTALTRVQGPGLTFTRGGEYFSDDTTLDLRKQVRTAEQVQALTRDGIEIVADIRVIFVLDSGESQALRSWLDPARPPYGFNSANAAAAVYGKPYRDRTNGLWAELPPLVAADVFREVVSERDFEALFSATANALPLLAGVEYQIEKRLTGLFSDLMTREQQLLAGRGLRVIAVRLVNLRLPEDVRKKRLANWREDWRSRAGELAADKDPQIRLARQDGADQGRLQVLEGLASRFAEPLRAGPRPGRKETAAGLTAATRRLAQDPALQGAANVAEVKRLLEDLELWVKGWRDQ